jgi:hypothetical protein
MILRTAASAALLACLSGCMSFESQNAEDIATSGANYTSNTKVLIDEAIKSANHSDSRSMVFMKVPGSMLGTPEFTPEAMKEKLETSNAGLIGNAEKAYQLKASLDTVNAYFIGLQELVRDPTAERNALAVENLATQVNDTNRTLEGNRGGPLISREKKDALVQLTRVISDQIKARKVKQAVKRDAEVIATALYLQNEILDWAEMNILGDLTSMTNRFYVEHVEVPYAEQSDRMNDRWVDDRMLYLKSQAFIKDYRIRQAKRDQSMYEVELWSSALTESYDQTVISRQIRDIFQLIDMKKEIEKASKK